MTSPLSSGYSSQSLQLLYATKSLPVAIRNTIISDLPEDWLRENYRVYFDAVAQKTKNFLLVEALKDEGLIAEPESKGMILVHFLLSAIGTAVPIFEVLSHSVRLIPHLLGPGLHLLHGAGESAIHAIHYQHYHPHIGISDLQGERLKNFVDTLVVQLTYSFRHELSLLTPRKCRELGTLHYNQIKDCLKYLTTSSTHQHPTAAEVFDFIINSIDPDPKAEIEWRVAEYVMDRQDRSLRSKSLGREGFIYEFLKKLDQNDTDLRKLIDKLGRSTLFNNDGIFRDNVPKSIVESDPDLSLTNPILNELRAYTGVERSNLSNEEVLTFNTAYMTAIFNNISFKTVVRAIIPQMMRLHTLRVVDGNSEINQSVNTQATEIIKSLPNPEAYALRQENVRLNQRVITLETQMADLLARMTRIEQGMGGLQASMPSRMQLALEPPRQTVQRNVNIPPVDFEERLREERDPKKYVRIIFEAFSSQEPLDVLDQRYQQLQELEEGGCYQGLPRHHFWIAMQANRSYLRRLEQLQGVEKEQFQQVWESKQILTFPLEPLRGSIASTSRNQTSSVELQPVEASS